MKKHPQKAKAIKKVAAKAAKKAVKMEAAAQMSSAQLAHKKARVQALANMKSYNPGMDKYLNVLVNPFVAKPYPLGFGTAVPTSVATGFRKFTLAPSGTTTAWAVRLIPTNSNLFLQTYENALATALLSASTVTNQAPQNSSAIATVANQARVIAAGLRIVVRYATTNTRGNIFAVPVYSDTITNLQALSFSTLSGLESANWGEGGGGEIAMECTYRPLDLTSYEFGTYSLAAPTLSQYIPMLLIGGTGWVASSFAVEVNMVLHLETIGGVLASAADDRCGPGSSDEALRASANAPEPTRILNPLNINEGHVEKLRSAFRVVKSTSSLASQLHGVIADGIGGYFPGISDVVKDPIEKEEKKEQETGEIPESRPLSPTSYMDLNPLDLDSLSKDQLVTILKSKVHA